MSRATTLYRQFVSAVAGGRVFPTYPAWKLGALTLALALVVVLLVVAPFNRGLAVQAVYLPILLAAWLSGPVGAVVAGLTASAIVLLVGHATGDVPLQSAVFLSFSIVCSLTARGLGEVSGNYRRMALEPETTPSGRERVLASLARTVEVRDQHTQGHCRRVARNAVALGQKLGLDKSELEILYWSGLLHDLGKIAVPEYILMKNGRLSEEEFTEIRRHPAYGADLLASVSNAFRPIAEVVRSHHERWDGLGYPLGLHGEDIPLLARVIAVVDVFEALTSDRPYRSPMPVEQAMRYISHGADTQFDPAIVASFEALVLEGGVDSADGITDPTLSGIRAEQNPIQYTL